MYIYTVVEGARPPRVDGIEMPLHNQRARDSSNASNNVPAPIAAGTIVLFTMMILALVAAAGTTAIWFRRRLRRTSNPERAVEPNATKFALRNVSPFDLVETLRRSGYAPDTSDAQRNSTVSTLLQQQLENELRSVQEKMVDLEDLERHAMPTADAQHNSGTHRILRLLSSHSTGTASVARGTQDLVSQLEAGRERNEALAARVRELEAHM